MAHFNFIYLPIRHKHRAYSKSTLYAGPAFKKIDAKFGLIEGLIFCTVFF